MDYIHGKKLFTDIYVQYGIGQPILFNFLNRFLSINYTSIGIITSIVYSLNLVAIYFGVKKITNTTLAFLISASALLLHTYSIQPWPDYYAGLFLTLGCITLIKNKTTNKDFHPIFIGSLFYAAFLFRSTYALSFIAASLPYLIMAMIKKSWRDKKIIGAIVVYFILLSAYLIILYFDGNFIPWYKQAIGAATSQYKVGSEKLIELLKIAFYPGKLYLPNRMVANTLSAMFFISVYTLFNFTFKKDSEKNYGIPAFLALLALAGLIQGIHSYHVFRTQNSCSPLYFVLAFFIYSKFPNFIIEFKNRKLIAALGLYYILLIPRIPYASVYFPIFEGKFNSYSKTEIPFFGFHRFRSQEKDYYDCLYRYICDGKKRIVNLTLDSVIPYLCSNQDNALSLPFYHPTMLSIINMKQLTKVQAGEFDSDEIIVSEELPITNASVKLVNIGKVFRPMSIKYCSEKYVFIYSVENLNNKQ